MTDFPTQARDALLTVRLVMHDVLERQGKNLWWSELALPPLRAAPVEQGTIFVYPHGYYGMIDRGGPRDLVYWTCVRGPLEERRLYDRTGRVVRPLERVMAGDPSLN